MDIRKSILEKYVNYNPEEDPNGSQGQAIADSVMSVFGSYESFNKYKKQQEKEFIPSQESLNMTKGDAMKHYLGKIKKRLDDSIKNNSDDNIDSKI
jgi:hypothetical protein